MKRSYGDALAKFEKTVQLSLDDNDVAQILAWELDDAQIFALMESMQLEGYSFSMYYDKQLESWTVSIMGKFAHCRNGGYLVYGNGATFLGALKTALFKTSVMLEGLEWSDVAGSNTKNAVW